MAKLSEGQVDQIRNMREDGKTYQEVMQFFRDNYKIKLYTNQIVSASKVIKSHLKPFRHKKIMRTASEIVALEKTNEFAFHIHQAFDIHKKDFIKRVEEALAIL